MINNPLTDAEYRRIQTALGHVIEAREALQKAQDAGLPMEEPLAILDIHQHRLEGIKRGFFAHKP